MHLFRVFVNFFWPHDSVSAATLKHYDSVSWKTGWEGPTFKGRFRG
jgi:hypothetical protein